MKSKTDFFVLTVIALIAIVALTGSQVSSDNKVEVIKRGENLVDLGGCNLCHTPKIMTPSGMGLDQTRLLSGHPEDDTLSEYTTEVANEEGEVTNSNFHMTRWSGPWGISYASNLTPDEATGIGSWSEEDFIQTIRTGMHLGSGDKIQLPMPWNVFAHMTDDDLSAIFAYLQSIKPIRNDVPPSIPAAENVGGDSE